MLSATKCWEKCLIENKTLIQQNTLVKLHLTWGAKRSNTDEPTNVVREMLIEHEEGDIK